MRAVARPDSITASRKLRSAFRRPETACVMHLNGSAVQSVMRAHSSIASPMLKNKWPAMLKFEARCAHTKIKNLYTRIPL